MSVFLYGLLIKSIIFSILGSLIYFIFSSLFQKNIHSKKIYYGLFFFSILVICPNSLFEKFSSIFQNNFFQFLPYQISYILTTINTCIYIAIKYYHILDIIYFVWIFGFLFILIKQLFAFNKFKCLLTRWNEDDIDNESINIMTMLIRELNLNGKKITLKKNRMITTPLIIGILKPTIEIPNEFENLDPEEKRLLLFHELVHYKRQDNLIKMIAFFIQSLFWFNIFFKFLNTYINLYCDLSCDQMVLKESNNQLRKKYGKMLLIVAEKQINQKSALFCSFSNKNMFLEKRINLIFKNQKATKFSTFITYLLSFLILIIGQQFPNYNYNVINAYNTIDENGNFNFDEQFGRELMHQTYKQYEKYGLLYNKTNDCLFFNGTLVHEFSDTAQKKFYSQETGTLDISITRDKHGEIENVVIKKVSHISDDN